MALRSFHLGMPRPVMPSNGFSWSPTLSGREFRPIIFVFFDLRAAEHPTLTWMRSKIASVRVVESGKVERSAMTALGQARRFRDVRLRSASPLEPDFISCRYSFRKGPKADIATHLIASAAPASRSGGTVMPRLPGSANVDEGTSRSARLEYPGGPRRLLEESMVMSDSQ